VATWKMVGEENSDENVVKVAGEWIKLAKDHVQ
jgi:hypothetical protein